MDEIKRKCIEAIRSLAPEKNFSVYVRSRSKSEIGDWIHVNRYCYAKVEWMLLQKTYLAYRTPWANPREHYIDTPNYLKEDK